ncbi:MAG: hypothetical protein ACKOYN_06325 [Planctomycetota bacterium]
MNLGGFPRLAWIALAVVAAVLLSAAGEARPEGAERWKDRLERLDPLDPLGYLELAEEVADAAEREDERRLAAELYGLAGALDVPRLGRSAMLGLSSLAREPAERARTLAAAAILGASHGGSAAASAEPLSQATDQQIDALARAFSYHRRGDGRRAMNALRQSGADELLEAVGPVLPGGAAAFRDECRAMRSGGGPGADPETARAQMLIELALRQGRAAPLGVEMALTGDRPLVEVDLSDPQSVWRVDPRRPWWRNGGWASSQ